MKRKNKPDAEGQLEAAHIIAAEPLKYPGVMQDWAKLRLKRTEVVLQKAKQPASDGKDSYKHQEPGDDGKVPW